MRFSWIAKFLFLVLSCSLQVQAQQHYNYPLNRYSQFFLEREDSTVSSGIQGLPESWLALDSVWGFTKETTYGEFQYRLKNAHLIEVEKEDFNAYIDLLLHFDVGFEWQDESQYSDTSLHSRNLRGFRIVGDIGDKVSFETSFREIQTRAPFYLFDYVVQSDVMPGTGRVKRLGNELDHNIAEGYISYSPLDRLNIQFGSQKNFIGSGYRSLLLSDHAYTYPQLKIGSRWWEGRIHYQVIHAWIQTLERLPIGDTPESLFRPKGANFYYLSIEPWDKVRIGLFEGVVWSRFDEEEGTLPMDGRSYIPIIGVNTALMGLDGEGNSLVGLDLAFRALSDVELYGQLIWDQEGRDGQQLGVKTLGLIDRGLRIQVEYNRSSPFTYANNPVDLNYAHFGQPLAHPMGAGFEEAFLGLTYFRKRWFMDAKYVHATQLVDLIPVDGPFLNVGSDIFQSDEFGVDDPEGNDIQLDHVEVRIGYFFNPRSNFNAYLGWKGRTRTGRGFDQEMSFTHFGIEMSLFQTYEDF